MHAVTALSHFHIRDRGIEIKVDLVLHLRIQIFQHNIIDICTKMTNRGIQQIQFVLQTKLFQVRSCGGVHLCSLSAIFHIDLVHILHQLNRLCLADVFI